MITPVSREKIEDRVTSMVAELLGVEKNTLTTTDELNVDSLALAELLISIDTEFKVHIPDEEAQNIHTIQALVDHLMKKLSSSAKG